MKEKPIFEEVFVLLIRQPNFGLKLLIGGLLSFVPIANIFAFGYLYRFSARLRRTGQLHLPEWNDWAGLFSDGLKFGLVWLVYWVLPLLVALSLGTVLSAVGLGAISYLLLSAVFLVVSLLFCSALYRLQMRSDYKDLLDVVLIVRMTYLELPRFVIPVLVFAGVCALTLPIYGFAFFVGFLLLITQTGLCFRSIESR